MNTILITGASGYLAHRLIPIAASISKVVGTVHKSSVVTSPAELVQLDITDKYAVEKLVSHVQPSAIIHASACNPGVDETLMDAVNHKGTGYIARAASKHNSRLVVVSTDVVHDGSNAPYADNASPTPINIYGKTKALGELAAQKECQNAAIVRTSLIYGLEKMDRGTSGFVARIETGKTLGLFTDVLRQPVWVDALSQALCQLAFNYPQVSGTINVAGEQVLSRAEFAVKLLKYWGISVPDNLDCIFAKNIEGVPLDLRLGLERAKSIGLAVPGVDEVLRKSTIE